MKQEKEYPAYYAIITSDVRYSKEINANEKLLFAEITALSNIKGVCWASNNYFAELYECTPQAISKWINNLQKNGFISIQYVYKNGTKEIEKRFIKCINNSLEGINNGCLGINNGLGGYQHTIKDNITSINNNKYNNIQARKKSKKNDTKIPTFDVFEKYALEKKPEVNLIELKRKYDSWIMNEWHDGNGAKIVSWTSKLNNTLPYIKENVPKPSLSVREKTRDDFWNEAQYKDYCLKNNLEYKTNE